MKKVSLLLIILLAIYSCKATKEKSSQNMLELKGSFKVMMLNGKEVSDKGLTFIIDDSTNTVSGNSGCNTYSGSYELSETNTIISFSGVFGSKKYCAEKEKNDIEREYLNALSKRYRIVLKKERIELEATDDSTQKISLVKE